jgi:hypothetical protein
MSRNNKNARLQKAEEALPKNRSAAAKERRANGEVKKPGRATAPKHNKSKAWWQTGDKSYTSFVKGGGKKQRKNKEETATIEVAIQA